MGVDQTCVDRKGYREMGLIDSLGRMLTPSRQKERVDLKEIFCKRKDEDYIKRFRTAAAGAEFKNIDGSSRQEVLEQLKIGVKVRLIWDAGNSRNKQAVYLVKSGSGRRLSMADCFGRLNDKIAADVVRWLNRENIVTSAKVVKIIGGTRKRPKLGCTLELTTYHGTGSSD
jgi:hypothetical protein